MKYFYLIIILITSFSCSGNRQNEQTNGKKNNAAIERLVLAEFQQILDSSNVEGSILIYDPQTAIFYSNDFQWAALGKLPASTFKIPNSIIALETEVVENDSTLFIWNGEKRNLSIWEQDLLFKDAFRFSCVPCYQDIARKIGEKRMKEYLSNLKYGNMVFDSTNIDLFWLVGDSEINQFEQIDFLSRLHYSKLPISGKTDRIMKRLMILDNNQSYCLSGKTGWSVRNGHNNGWFVGYLEIKEKVYFFAVNIDPKEKFNMQLFSKIRKEITMNAFKKLNLI